MPPKNAPRYDTNRISSDQNAVANSNIKFKCRVCLSVKDQKHYSKKEMTTYHNKLDRGIRVNGETAQLRCRPCSGGANSEMFCEGPCDQYKALSEFSKNSRGNGGNRWCQECTHWKQSIEPDLNVTAPPNHKLAADEDGGFYQGDDMPTYEDPEGGDDSDDDWEHASSAWGASNNATARSSIAGSAVSYDLPMDQLANLNVSGPPSVASSAWGKPSVVSSSNSFHSSSVPSGNPVSAATGSNTADEGSWTAVDARRRNAAPAGPGPIPFHAWDNTGAHHLQQRYPSSAEESSESGYSAGSSNVSVVSDATVRGQELPNSITTSGRLNNWAKPINSIVSNGESGRSGNSNWAKPITIPKPEPKYVPTRPKTAPAKVVQQEDSDSDEDYM